MSDLELSADCARCAALCCVAFTFDRSHAFAIDKKAGVPCPHLAAGARCAIHAERAARGFGGCIAYDCHGAGQRVTQKLFAGRNWIGERDSMPAMAAAFLTVERAHRMLLILGQARKLPLSPGEAQTLKRLEEDIEAAGASGEAIARLEKEARHFLKGLGRLLREG